MALYQKKEEIVWTKAFKNGRPTSRAHKRPIEKLKLLPTTVLKKKAMVQWEFEFKKIKKILKSLYLFCVEKFKSPWKIVILAFI